MPQFDYKASKQDGTTVSGTIEVSDRRQAVQRLKAQKLNPIALKEAGSSKRFALSKLGNKIKSLNSSKNNSADEKSSVSQGSGSPSREKTGHSP